MFSLVALSVCQRVYYSSSQSTSICVVCDFSGKGIPFTFMLHHLCTFQLLQMVHVKAVKRIRTGVCVNIVDPISRINL